jgi:hypothetical protein
MQNTRYSLYENDVLVYQEDTRLVSVCSDRKLAEIRYKCAELIAATGIDWMVQREVSGGKPIPQDVKDLCASYRARSNELEQRIAEVKTWASSDEDKAVCDTIEAIAWNE